MHSLHIPALLVGFSLLIFCSGFGVVRQQHYQRPLQSYTKDLIARLPPLRITTENASKDTSNETDEGDKKEAIQHRATFLANRMWRAVLRTAQTQKADHENMEKSDDTISLMRSNTKPMPTDAQLKAEEESRQRALLEFQSQQAKKVEEKAKKLKEISRQNTIQKAQKEHEQKVKTPQQAKEVAEEQNRETDKDAKESNQGSLPTAQSDLTDKSEGDPDMVPEEKVSLTTEEDTPKSVQQSIKATPLQSQSSQPLQQQQPPSVMSTMFGRPLEVIVDGVVPLREISRPKRKPRNEKQQLSEQQQQHQEGLATPGAES